MRVSFCKGGAPVQRTNEYFRNISRAKEHRNRNVESNGDVKLIWNSVDPSLCWTRLLGLPMRIIGSVDSSRFCVRSANDLAVNLMLFFWGRLDGWCCVANERNAGICALDISANSLAHVAISAPEGVRALNCGLASRFGLPLPKVMFHSGMAPQCRTQHENTNFSRIVGK